MLGSFGARTQSRVDRAADRRQRFNFAGPERYALQAGVPVVQFPKSWAQPVAVAPAQPRRVARVRLLQETWFNAARTG